jgi:hypothetical protein
VYRTKDLLPSSKTELRPIIVTVADCPPKQLPTLPAALEQLKTVFHLTVESPLPDNYSDLDSSTPRIWV